MHAASRIRTHSLTKRAVADLRLWPRGQWERRKMFGEKLKGYSACSLGPFISSANKNSSSLFVMPHHCFSACSPQNFAVYHVVDLTVPRVCYVISYRVASVSSSRSSWKLWQQRFCFSDSKLLIAPRPVPLVHSQSLWGLLIGNCWMCHVNLLTLWRRIFF